MSRTGQAWEGVKEELADRELASRWGLGARLGQGCSSRLAGQGPAKFIAEWSEASPPLLFRSTPWLPLS